MKIIITEHETVRGFKEGSVRSAEVYSRPTGRHWEIEIPVESVSIDQLWTDIKGDIRELIQLAKNSLRK